LPIVTPILDRDTEYKTKFGYCENYIKEDDVNNVDLEHQDKALVFVNKDKSLPQHNLSRDLDENLTSSKHLVEERGNSREIDTAGFKIKVREVIYNFKKRPSSQI
jgi:hypothetical protein